jgi:hypothetical protein
MLMTFPRHETEVRPQDHGEVYTNACTHARTHTHTHFLSLFAWTLLTRLVGNCKGLISVAQCIVARGLRPVSKYGDLVSGRGSF